MSPSGPAEMDHLDRIKQNREVLGLESLGHLSLAQLLEAINKNLHSGVSRHRILNIYVLWLHERLTTVDIPAQEAVANAVAEWYEFLKAAGYGERLIAEAFYEWQHDEATNKPTSSRRLSIIEAEFRHLVSVPHAGANQVPARANPEEPYDQMHPDRVKLSRATPSVTEFHKGEDGVVVLLDTTPENRDQSPDAGRDSRMELSFLTGSNRLGIGDIPDFPHNMQRVGITHSKTELLPSKPLISRVVNQRDETTRIVGKPGPDYVCDRCGRPGMCYATLGDDKSSPFPGHFLKDCPTNIDPAYDRTPPKHYKCKICKKSGDHYLPLCPKNKDPSSITQLRRRAALFDVQAGPGLQAKYSRDFRNDRALRFQDSRWSRADDGSRRGSRSRSPARKTGGSRHHEEPRFVFESTSHLPPSLGEHPGKRKVSSPLCAEDSASWKQARHGDKGNAMNPSRKRVTFGDEVVIEIGSRDEGRLSYYDECDMGVSATPLSKPTNKYLTDDKMDVDGPEMLVPQETKQSDGLQFSPEELGDMIRVESANTDLLLLVDGVELLPPHGLGIVKLFRGQDGVWINGAVKKDRPRPAEFFDLPLESVQNSDTGVQSNLVSQKAAPEEQPLNRVSVDEQAAHRAAEPLDPARQAGDAANNNKAMLVDMNCPVGACVSVDEVKSMTDAAGSLQIHEHPLDEAEVQGSGAEPTEEDSTSVGSPTESVTKEQEWSFTEDEPTGITEPDLSPLESPPEKAVVHGETAGAHPPQPAEDTAMALELLPGTDGAAGTADDRGPMVMAPVEDSVNLKMGGVEPLMAVEETGPACQESEKTAAEAEASRIAEGQVVLSSESS